MRRCYTETLEDRVLLAVIPTTPGDDNLAGTPDADLFGPSAGDDTLDGLGGDDRIEGGTGDDELIGDGGKDTLLGGDDDDLLLGGTGDDVLEGGNDDDTLRADGGDDILEGGGGKDQLFGGSGDDKLAGGTADDELNGGDDDDLLRGQGGDDVLDGGAGNDTIVGGPGADAMDGGTGNDVFVHNVEAVTETILGGSGADELLIELGPDDRVTLELNGDDLLVLYDENGFAPPPSVATFYEGFATASVETIRIVGTAGGHEIVTVDSSLARANVHVDFDGVGAAKDAVNIDGPAQSMTFDLINPSDARVTTVTADGTVTFDFRNISSPVAHDGSVMHMTFNLPDTDDDVLLDDDSIVDLTPEAKEMGLLSKNGTFLPVDFEAPFGSLVINAGGGDDTITWAGTPPIFPTSSVFFNGEDGDDLIDTTAVSMNVHVSGGAGADTILTGAGNDLVHGDEGDDLINTDGGADSLLGEDGADTLLAGAGRDLLDGGAGDDLLEGGGGDDTLLGGDDNDTLDGGKDDDMLSGGAGDDVLLNGPGDDTIDGGDGEDELHAAGTVGKDTISAEIDAAGDLHLTINGDTQTYAAFEASSIERIHIDALGDDDVLTAKNVYTNTGVVLDYDGGKGMDSLVIDGLYDDVTVNYLFPMDPALRNALLAEYSSFGATGAIDATGLAPLAFVGSAKDMIFNLPFVDDVATLSDTGGADGMMTLDSVNGKFEDTKFTNPTNSLTINGDRPEDMFLGVSSEDDITVLSLDADFSASLTINGGEDRDDIDTKAVDYPVTLLGGNDDDRLRSGHGRDYHDGGHGDDTLIGRGGNDTLNGGDSDDTIRGGGGRDLIGGGARDDLIVGNGGRDEIWGDSHFDMDGQRIELLFPLHGKDTIRGGGGADSIWGERKCDNIAGNGGDDLIDGGQCDDILAGNAGADTIFGGDANDTIDGGGGADSLLGGAGDDSMDGGNGNDTMCGQDGDDFMLGGGGNDAMCGGAGNDTLNGMAGNDTLLGGEGNDNLLGGADADIVLGEEGDDTVNGQGHDADTIAGGPGEDCVLGIPQDGHGVGEIDESFTFTPDPEWCTV